MESRAAAAEPRSAQRDHEGPGRDSTPFEAFGGSATASWWAPRRCSPRTSRAELQRRPADVVVGNFFVFGAQIAAEAEGVPFAFLVSNLLSFRGSARRRSVPA